MIFKRALKCRSAQVIRTPLLWKNAALRNFHAVVGAILASIDTVAGANNQDVLLLAALLYIIVIKIGNLKLDL